MEEKELEFGPQDGMSHEVALVALRRVMARSGTCLAPPLTPSPGSGEGGQNHLELRFCDPFRVEEFCFALLSGGIAALNPRLLSCIPLGMRPEATREGCQIVAGGRSKAQTSGMR